MDDPRKMLATIDQQWDQLRATVKGNLSQFTLADQIKLLSDMMIVARADPKHVQEPMSGETLVLLSQLGSLGLLTALRDRINADAHDMGVLP